MQQHSQINPGPGGGGKGTAKAAASAGLFSGEQGKAVRPIDVLLFHYGVG